MSEWQSINTAPRDEPVLLWADYCLFGYWDHFYGEDGHWCVCHSGDPINPSHWMHLPQPPESPAK